MPIKQDSFLHSDLGVYFGINEVSFDMCGQYISVVLAVSVVFSDVQAGIFSRWRLPWAGI